ncbi:VCBS repeat-containing protein [Adhaeribacter aquaticus]|uniref:VCBS repeat-containing protein n=1 Tax=Adhaeribacter aquaticus TaxID=299567 RepID=UPI0003FF297B|nr:VCBS repeat-containing protein [Adhaeribacter aquaticus]
MKIKYLFFFSPLLFLFTQCNLIKQKEPLFTLLSPGDTGVKFNNTITETDTFNVLTFGYIYNGGGVAVGDVNNDGLQDLYFSGNMVSSKLYLNKGNFKFEDITLSSGTGTKTWINGVTMADVNQDGLLDIYASTVNPIAGQPQTPNLLFINQGLNKEGKPTFKEEAKSYGLTDAGSSTQATFFDFDQDGDLDMYLLRNAPDGTMNPNIYRPKVANGQSPSNDRLYRNNGDNTFTNISKEAGIQMEGRGLGMAISDINQDGWPDIYAANDFLTNDLLWINNKNGTFTNQAAQYLKHSSYNGMGTDIADYNNDGLPDIIEMDMLPEDNKRQKTTMDGPNYDRFQLNKRLGYENQYVRNTLQLNNGNGTFSEIGQLAGVYATDWSWSPLFADYDNDGLRDLFITNGYLKDMTDLDYMHYRSEESMFGSAEAIEAKLKTEFNKLKSVVIPNYIYQNRGDLTFADKTKDWGLEEPSNSNGAAYADLDNDGDLDLVVNNLNSEAFIYQNNAQQLNQNHYLNLRLQGAAPNREGIGATIRIKYKGQQQFYEHYPTRGYQSSVDPTVHFGLGKTAVVDSLEVIWPGGRYQLLRNVKPNQILVLDIRQATGTKPAPKPAPAPLFTEASSSFGIAYKHEEDDFIDFKNQPLMPHKLSQGGPGLAVGDVNGDGLDDFFVGGSARRSGTIFYQNHQGKFTSRPLTSVPNTEDDMGALFFDADNDKDLDLYVATGGNEYLNMPQNYLHRLYKNDGKGNFTLDENALPRITSSGSCVTAADYDQDGDLDLFVGGRNNPRQYPMPGQSCLLRNNGGTFTNQTASLCKELETIGMVTTALWTDFDQDGQVDLLVAGEWMPLTFFKNNKGKFTNVTASTGLTHTEGWWNSLLAADFDNDGDMDYVGGNLGLNSRYKASPEQPVTIVAKDFDKSGNVDPVMGYYIQGQNYPAPARDALTDQMVMMRKRFPRYADYAETTFEKLFTKEELEGAYTARSYTFQSSYIENVGNGKFQIKALPMPAQVAPVFGMVASDYNQDGNLDLLLAGNSYAPETAVGYYDAAYGTLLTGNGKGGFAAVAPKQTGFAVKGDAKAMVQLLTRDKEPLVLVSQNSDSLKVFRSKAKAEYQVVPLQATDAYAELEFNNGKKRREEFCYGTTYLSQSCRTLVGKDLASVYITNSQGKRRQINLDPKVIALK